MNLLDFLLILIVGYSVVAGFIAGFARVGVGFAATLLGILCGFWFYGLPASFIDEYVRSHAASNLLGFFVVFSIVIIAGGLLGRALSRAFKWAGLGWLDRFLGAGFGFLRGVVLALAIVTVVTAFAPNPPPRFIVNSRVMPYASVAGRVFAALAPYELKTSYNQSLAELTRLWNRMDLPKSLEKLKGEAL